MLPLLFFELAILILGATAAVPPHRREPLHIPIVCSHNARRDGEANLDGFAAAAQYAKRKYGRPNLSRRMTQDISIINQDQDLIYLVQVSVGTPPQPFSLGLSTYYSDLWFATTSCSGCNRSTPLFDTTKSSTFQTGNQTIQLTYGSGDNVTGTLTRDTVSMGPLTVTQQEFVAVSAVSSGFIAANISGVMGLAFQGNAQTGAVPFWQALVANNQLTNPEFSFAITRFGNDQSATYEEPGGVFTLGGTNSTLYQGTIDFQTFTPLVTIGSYWLQTISSINVDGTSVNLGNLRLAAIDIGTGLIYGPSQAVTSIWNAVPGAKPLTGKLAGYWGFPCTTQFTVSISFGGPSWPIGIDDLNLGTIGGGQCLGAIVEFSTGTKYGTQNTPAWTMGTTFLKNVYSVFRASNPPAVGFALLSQGQATLGSSGTPISVPNPGPARSSLLPTPSFNGASRARHVTSFGNVDVLATGVLSFLTVVFMLAA